MGRGVLAQLFRSSDGAAVGEGIACLYGADHHAGRGVCLAAAYHRPYLQGLIAAAVVDDFNFSITGMCHFPVTKGFLIAIGAVQLVRREIVI